MVRVEYVVPREIMKSQYQIEPPYVGYFDSTDTGNSTREILTTEDNKFTGLYDSEGNPLYKQKPRIGFL